MPPLAKGKYPILSLLKPRDYDCIWRSCNWSGRANRRRSFILYSTSDLRTGPAIEHVRAKTSARRNCNDRMPSARRICAPTSGWLWVRRRRWIRLECRRTVRRRPPSAASRRRTDRWRSSCCIRESASMSAAATGQRTKHNETAPSEKNISVVHYSDATHRINGWAFNASTFYESSWINRVLTVEIMGRNRPWDMRSKARVEAMPCSQWQRV